MDAATPNWFATAALLAWPVVALWLYSTRPVTQATLWTILGAQFLLPVGAFIKLAPGIPQLDKISIPGLAALAGCVFVARRQVRFWNGFGLTEVLLLMSFIAPFVTSELNGDPIMIGNAALPSVDQYDALSAVVAQFIFLLPFFVGRHFFRNSADNEEVLRILLIAGLLYSVPMLFEIRMSPQLNYWFYGYYQFGFSTQMRDGGFRPTVFMDNGLVVSFFAMTATVAATAFWRAKIRIMRLPSAGITIYMSAVLILCKSLGALIYGATLMPLVRLAKPRLQLHVALMLVALAVLYPLLRASNFVPTKSMLEAAATISEERAQSLQVRFDNEQRLLEHASERILFGWGRFGRSRVYDDSGKDISITDGRWIITIGQFGLFGFLAEFGLLAMPVFRAASALKFSETSRARILLAALALIVAINMIDLLPNASLSPVTWLMAGALLGRSEALLRLIPRRHDRIANQNYVGKRTSADAPVTPYPDSI